MGQRGERSGGGKTQLRLDQVAGMRQDFMFLLKRSADAPRAVFFSLKNFQK